MEHVDGIGGFFFKAKDPKTIANWHLDTRGVAMTPTSCGQQPWEQTAGPTAFQPFPAGTKSKEYPNGWFARLEDPEGNTIELWQPKGQTK